MLESILLGALVGVEVVAFLLMFLAFMVHQFNFKKYPKTFVICLTDKESLLPLWLASAFVVSIIGTVMCTGAGDVVSKAVFHGVVLYISTFCLYRVLWAFLEAATNLNHWWSVWDKTKVLGSTYRKVDILTNIIIAVTSTALMTWLVLSGVYG